MAKNISRSQYIRNLMEEKKTLQEQMQELTNDTIKNMLGETVKDTIKGILTEDENAFEEEEVVDDTVAQDGSEETITDTETEDENGSEEETAVDVVDGESEEGMESSDDADDSMWNELEQFKGEDGEYDLTGMDKEQVIRVLKVMGPEDGVRVVKNDDGTIKLNDDETDKEYIIDVDCADGECEDKGEEETFELEFEDEMDESKNNECNEANLGYTDNYQKDTAMTTPDNHEPANPKSTYSMDKGVPTGTSKPWAGSGDKAPFDEKVNEGEEDAVNETMTTQEQGPYNRGTGMVHTNTNSKAAKGRNAHAGGKQIHGTADNSYSEAQLENIKRMANEVFLENKQLKSILPQIKQQLQEAIVINQSLSNMVKIMTENATSKEEKQDILNRFKEVKTREESNKLYKTITEEFKRNSNSQNVGNIINSQLAESKNHIVESPMYQSEDLSETLQFMTRLNKIK